MENVAKELECIMETGGYVFVLGLSSAFKDDCFEGKKSQICLKYVAHSQLHQKNSDKSSLNNNVEKPALKNIRAKHSQCLNNEQINEFLRKLGFIDKEKKEGDHCIKQFLYLSQVIFKINCINFITISIFVLLDCIQAVELVSKIKGPGAS